MAWSIISNIGAKQTYDDAGSTTALGTTATTITGLSLALTPGTWELNAQVPIVNVGAPTNTDIRAVAATGLVTTTSNYTVSRYTATALSVVALTTLNASSGAAQASNILTTIAGLFVVTVAGTLTFTGTRTGGTSQTVQSTAYAKAIRLA